MDTDHVHLPLPSLIINYIQYYNIILQLEDLFTYSQGIKSYRFWCFQSISCGGASGGVASIFVLSCRIGYKNDSKWYFLFLWLFLAEPVVMNCWEMTFPHRNYVGPKKLMWLKAFTVCFHVRLYMGTHINVYIYIYIYITSGYSL